MDTLYTFWDNTTHYKTKSVPFGGLMNPATKIRSSINKIPKGPSNSIVYTLGAQIPIKYLL